MSQIEPASDSPGHQAKGLRYARWGGMALGIYLGASGLWSLLGAPATSFGWVQAVYGLLYGGVLCLPYERLPERNWSWAYGLLVLLSVGFVFVMIVAVMFAYMAAANRGERLGVPGLEGTLIFLALLQVPVVLFQRKPDLLD